MSTNSLQPADFQCEVSTVWDFPKRGSWATHKPDYRGNFAPEVARNVLLAYSEPGETVLDPMVGSGTTLIEARLLDRNAVGVDINPSAVDMTRQRTSFPMNNRSKQLVTIGDARHLDTIGGGSIDLVVMHPPYWTMVKYSSDLENDLSRISDLDDFFKELTKAIQEAFRVLKQGRYLAVLIGDTRRAQHYVPLSHYLLDILLRSGFLLKEEIIKTQHNCRYTERWRVASEHHNFFLIMHEHLFILRKPCDGENLQRFQYSSWRKNGY